MTPIAAVARSTLGFPSKNPWNCSELSHSSMTTSSVASWDHRLRLPLVHTPAEFHEVDATGGIDPNPGERGESVKAPVARPWRPTLLAATRSTYSGKGTFDVFGRSRLDRGRRGGWLARLRG